MEKIIRVKHSFNSGDLVVLLPGMQHIYQTKGYKFVIYQRLNFAAYYYNGATSPILNKDGEMVCMNEEMFLRMKPLLEKQEYIESFEIWEGEQFDWDIDLSRDSRSIPMPAGLIHHYAWALIPELSCDLSKKWLEVKLIENNFYSDKIIVSRTNRYNNPYITYFFLKEYADRLLFSGTEGEYTHFCNEWNLDIPLLKTNDFHELSQIINSCKGVLSNQTLFWHLTDALKVNRILELCPQFPNTFPTGANGNAFFHQKSLEFYFKNIVNE